MSGLDDTLLDSAPTPSFPCLFFSPFLILILSQPINHGFVKSPSRNCTSLTVHSSFSLRTTTPHPTNPKTVPSHQIKHHIQKESISLVKPHHFFHSFHLLSLFIWRRRVVFVFLWGVHPIGTSSSFFFFPYTFTLLLAVSFTFFFDTVSKSESSRRTVFVRPCMQFHTKALYLDGLWLFQDQLWG